MESTPLVRLLPIGAVGGHLSWGSSFYEFVDGMGDEVPFVVGPSPGAVGADAVLLGRAGPQDQKPSAVAVSSCNSWTSVTLSPEMLNTRTDRSSIDLP